MPVGPTGPKGVSPQEHLVSCLPSFLFAPWRLLCCIGRCFKRVFCCGSASRPPSHHSTLHPSLRATPSQRTTSYCYGFSSANSSPSLLDLGEVTVWAPKEKTPLANRNNGLTIGGIRNKEEPALSEPGGISEAEGSGNENPLDDAEPGDVSEAEESDNKSPADNPESLKEEPALKKQEEPADQEKEPSVPSTIPSEDSGFLGGLSFPSLPSFPFFSSEKKEEEVQQKPPEHDFFDDVAISVSALGNFFFGGSPSPSKAPIVLGKVEIISPSASGERHPKIVVEEEESSESETESSPHGGLVDIARPPSSPLAELLGSGGLLPQPEKVLLPPPPVPLPDSTLPPPPLEEGLSPLSPLLFPDLELSPLPEVIVDDSDLWQREVHPRYSLDQLRLITYLADRIDDEISNGMSLAWTESLEKALKKNRLGRNIVYKMLFPDEHRNRKGLLGGLFQDPIKITETLDRIRALEEAKDQMIANGSWREGSSKYSPEVVELFTYLTPRYFYDVTIEDPIRSWIFDTLHESNNVNDFETYCYVLGCKTTTEWRTYYGPLIETAQNPAKVKQALATAKRVKAHIDQHGDFPTAKQEYSEIPEHLKSSHPHYSSEALELLTYLPAFCIPDDVIVLESEEDLDRNRAFWQVQERNVLSISCIYNLLGCMDREIKGDNIGAILQQRCDQGLRDILESPKKIKEILGKMQEAREYAKVHGHSPCIGHTKGAVNEIIQHGLSLKGFPLETVTLGIELTSLYFNRDRLNALLYSVNPYSAYSVLLEHPLEVRRELHEKLCKIVYPNSEFIADKISSLSNKEKIDVDEKLLDLFKDIEDSDIENIRRFIDGHPTIYQENGITVDGLMEYIRIARGKMNAYKEAKKQLAASEDLLTECLERKTEASKTYKAETKGKITRDQKVQAEATLKEKNKELDEDKRRLEAEIKALKGQVRNLTQDKGAQESLIAIGMLMGIAP